MKLATIETWLSLEESFKNSSEPLPKFRPKSGRRHVQIAMLAISGDGLRTGKGWQMERPEFVFVDIDYSSKKYGRNARYMSIFSEG
jgi:hypothetical protein